MSSAVCHMPGLNQEESVKFCRITGLPFDEQRRRAFLASWLSLECRLVLGPRYDEQTLKVYAWIDGEVIPALQASSNDDIQHAVDYFIKRSYGRKHLLYLWHLLKEEKERATQDQFVTWDVYEILMRGNLEELKIPYQQVMDKYGL